MADDPKSVRDALRAAPGAVESRWLRDGEHGARARRQEPHPEELAAEGSDLADLQERLYAESTEAGVAAVLLVLQGMDTSGKGGVIEARHRAVSTRRACTSRRSRSRPRRRRRTTSSGGSVRRCRAPGIIGVFDRSHYEDVLVARVHELVPEEVWRRRYDEINPFEAELVEQGTTVIKCLLHISYDEQRERLLARLDDPTKHWKFNEGDLDERALGRLPGGVRGRAASTAHRRARRGTRSQPTGSGTGTGRSASCCSRPSATSIRAIPSALWTLSGCAGA